MMFKQGQMVTLKGGGVITVSHCSDEKEIVFYYRDKEAPPMIHTIKYSELILNDVSESRYEKIKSKNKIRKRSEKIKELLKNG